MDTVAKRNGTGNSKGKDEFKTSVASEGNTKSIKNLLCLIIDLNYESWTLKKKEMDNADSSNDVDMNGDSLDLSLMQSIIGKMCLFLNSYMMQSASNEAAIYGSFAHEAVLLKLSSEDTTHLDFASSSKSIMDKICALYSDPEFLGKMASKSSDNHSKIGSALKKSNCFINSWKLNNSRADTSCNARILIFQASPDNNDDYYSMVNSIFACQK